ncbi:phospholipase D family protein [Bartonella sp. TP]|uniref:phospholipase D-like domain-containing protein n=1 Tax=Bartonella sp. TP TaxID=3057550 RepID=UPI0025AF53BC|nr:phospholipase D family protein [Bartonella sp. TP]WJW80231.1 phospholipase D family protein [Bartonella sp. TP]
MLIVGIIIILCALGVFFAAALSELVYNKFAKRSRGGFSYAFNKEDSVTEIDKALQQLAEKHGGLGYSKNALALIKENEAAFAARLLSARMAGRSLDLMYYIFEDDKVGKILLYELLQAANRGVRVRLLIDDINVGTRDQIFVALDKHENIDIRVFNPCRARSFSIKRFLELALRALSLTRRMHNKAYIADGRVAFVGGRNIADAYFSASQNSTFRDLDVMLTGPILNDVERVFDLYWNSRVVLPIRKLALSIKARDIKYWENKLRSYCETEPIKQFIDEIAKIPFSYFLRAEKYIFAVKQVCILADPPQKALGGKNKNWLMNFLFPRLQSAAYDLQVTSPYFVPGKIGSEQLKNLAKRGVQVRVLTNSLATTDVPIAYGGYIHYRKDLLKAGVNLYELMPPPVLQTRNAQEGQDIKHYKLRLLARNRASLHTKAFLIDEAQAFVGSFNFDMRSVSLNTEMGVFFECPKLAMHMNLLFCEETTNEMSYALGLNKAGKIFWSFTENKVKKTLYNAPKTTRKLQFYVKLLSLLPIKAQL